MKLRQGGKGAPEHNKDIGYMIHFTFVHEFQLFVGSRNKEEPRKTRRVSSELLRAEDISLTRLQRAATAENKRIRDSDME